MAVLADVQPRALDRHLGAVDERLRRLEWTSHAQHRLVVAAVGGADDVAMLGILAELLDKPVFLRDGALEAVAAVAPDGRSPLEPSVSARSRWAAVARRCVRDRHHPTFLPPSPSTGYPHRHLLCPVVGQDGGGGFLDVIEVGRIISTSDVMVVEAAAAVIALVLAQDRNRPTAAADAPDRLAVRSAYALLAPLLAYDAAADGHLLETLRSYLSSGGRVRDTAVALGVHKNTVRYRLGRMREIAGIDVDDLDHLLDVRAALRVLDATAPPGGAP